MPCLQDELNQTLLMFGLKIFDLCSSQLFHSLLLLLFCLTDFNPMFVLCCVVSCVMLCCVFVLCCVCLQTESEKQPWTPVLVVVTEKDLLLYDGLPRGKEGWHSPAHTYPLLATRYDWHTSESFMTCHGWERHISGLLVFQESPHKHCKSCWDQNWANKRFISAVASPRSWKWLWIANMKKIKASWYSSDKFTGRFGCIIGCVYIL